MDLDIEPEKISLQVLTPPMALSFMDHPFGADPSWAIEAPRIPSKSVGWPSPGPPSDPTVARTHRRKFPTNSRIASPI
jgi:hypothetical protein